MNTTTNTADLPLDVIDPDPANQARPVDDAFAASIAAHGVLQPILVTPTADDRYRIVAGERRYRAAKAAGHTTIPAVIRDTGTDTDAGVWQAVENLARADLTPSQEALAVARIMSEGMKQKALAAALNRPLSWVRARLALAGLPTNVQQAIDLGRFEISDALTFAKYTDRPEVIDAVLDAHYVNDVEWELERINRRYDQAQAILTVVEDLTGRGITAYPGQLPDDVTAKPLDHLAGIDPAAHETEPCHIAVVKADRWGDGDVQIVAYCTDHRRHHTKGDSTLTVTKPVTARSPERQAELDEQKAQRAAKAHRDAFARDAISGRIRAKDLTAVVLPVLLATAGQTELTDAAKLLAVTEPDTSPHGHKDWAGPFRTWATESTANLQRAFLAIAYVEAARTSWYPDASAAVATWLDQLGYEPPAD
ncbi:MAG: ParB/RepB/Spo0J family partition protein [Desertimonas sp.]